MCCKCWTINSQLSPYLQLYNESRNFIGQNQSCVKKELVERLNRWSFICFYQFLVQVYSLNLKAINRPHLMVEDTNVTLSSWVFLFVSLRPSLISTGFLSPVSDISWEHNLNINYKLPIYGSCGEQMITVRCTNLALQNCLLLFSIVNKMPFLANKFVIAFDFYIIVRKY